MGFKESDGAALRSARGRRMESKHHPPSRVAGPLVRLVSGAIRSRQRQGIDSARARGKKFGRPAVKITSDVKAIFEKWESGEINAVEAMRQSGLKRTSFYKIANARKNKE